MHVLVTVSRTVTQDNPQAGIVSSILNKSPAEIQLTANQTARLPFYGVKWPFSRGRGQ